MDANAAMHARWDRVRARAGTVPLAPALAALAASHLVDLEDALVLEALLTDSNRTPWPGDPTGYEAFVNHVHIERHAGTCDADDLLIQGVDYAERLVGQLGVVGRPCRVLLTRDPSAGSVIVRFFVRRQGHPWNDDNLDAYVAEEVMQWDVG